MKRISELLNRPTDAASLNAFRWMFGWLMFIDALRYLRFGWVSEYFIDPQFHFTYYGFEFVRPWPGIGMYVHFVVLGLCAIGIATGFFYRACAIIFTLGFSYVFLLEKAHYLNHFYVIILMASLLSWMPAHRLWSADASAGRVKQSDWIPAWPVYLLRGQLVLIYVYAGIAKLNSDWLSGQPLDMWLDVHKEVPVVGPILASRTAALVASYGGIFIDLILGPLLLVRRARVPALVIMASFHLLNSLIFSIGIFPWMMLGANLLFLDPDWPRRLPKVLNWILESGTHKQASPKPQRFAPLSPIVLACIAAWSTFQILFPLRHHLYPGDVAWTEEGHRYSWRMKLRDKRGPTNFYVAGADGKRRKVAIEKHLTKRQLFKLSCDPEMILEFAHYLADQEQRSGTPQPRVYARARCSLNGHPERDLINPDVDLAAIDDSLWPAAWILPLTEAGPKNRTK